MHLARHLLARGDEVHVLVRPETAPTRLQAIMDEVTVHRLGLADADALAQCLKLAAPDQVFHLASETRKTVTPGFAAARQTIAEYQLELITLLEALAGMPQPPKSLVRAGTIAEYGDAPTLAPDYEDQREAPTTPYGAAFTAGTHYIQMLAGILPFPVVTPRLALVYGAGQSDAFLIPAMIRACLEGRKTVIRSPSDRRDLIYIDDVIDALVRCADAPPPGCSVINIATGIAPTMREVAAIVIAATGVDPALVEFGDPDPDQAVSQLWVTTDRARELIGWSSTTALNAGIALTVEAMRRPSPVLT
jgi:UDP-glucose 4-epimerase